MAKQQNKPTKKDSEKLYVINNQRFQADCKKLNKLIIKAKSGTKEERAERRKTRDVMFASVCKSYDIPERTLRKHLKKGQPGKRDERIDKDKEKVKLPKIVDKIVSEVMQTGKSKTEAVKIAEDKAGVKISVHKAVKIKTDVEINESSFGVNMKKLIEAVFEIDKIAPGAFLPIEIVRNGKTFTFELHFETIQNIKLLLANEFNNSVEDRYKMICDRDRIKQILIDELFEENIRTAVAANDTKKVSVLINDYKKLRVHDTELSPNFNTAFKAARVFKRDLTKKEFIDAVKLVSRGDTNNG